MNSKILGIIAIIVAIGISVAVLSTSEIFDITTNEHADLDPEEDFLNVSGPFALDKSRYRLGENIFLRVDGLSQQDVGSIIYFLPNNQVYANFPIDGMQKSSFNTYFTPELIKQK